jgi:hypothetical protein
MNTNRNIVSQKVFFETTDNNSVIRETECIYRTI